VVEGGWSREGEYEGTYYRFDRAGNLVEQRDDEHDLHLVWDANQRLIESHSNSTATRYGYDPLGRRIFKETDDKLTLFFWDGDALVVESVVALDQPREFRPEIENNVIALAERREKAQATISQKVREYVYYPETFEPLAFIEGMRSAKRVYHYHNDPNGCPTRLTDINGEVRWAANYAAWGQISKLHVNGIDNPIRLQGQYADGETGLYYNRYRYFHPEFGAFISQDPLGVVAGEKFYFFAPNILCWIDPLGLACYLASRTPGGLKVGRRISVKQALQRLRRGLDVFADRVPEAKSLAKRVLKGRASHDPPHAAGYLPHFHPGGTHGIFGHVFHP
jgi:RHS repeat-associated protein